VVVRFGGVNLLAQAVRRLIELVGVA